jgi:hypothetical protein
MKTSNLGAVVGRKKCRKVLTKAAVHIQETAMHFGTAQQTENQNLESMETSYTVLSGSTGMITKMRSANPSLVSLFISLYFYFSPAF